MEIRECERACCVSCIKPIPGLPALFVRMMQELQRAKNGERGIFGWGTEIYAVTAISVSDNRIEGMGKKLSRGGGREWEAEKDGC